MVVVQAGLGMGMGKTVGKRGSWLMGSTAEDINGRVPEDGVLTGVDGTLEPGSKGFRDGDTLPTE